jgi:hypothetical protein
MSGTSGECLACGEHGGRGYAMKYSVEGDGADVKITVGEVGSKRAELIKELNECAEGRCSYPTAQYSKVVSMQIALEKDQLSITLKAKPGEKIDRGGINKCLEHTTQKVKKNR